MINQFFTAPEQELLFAALNAYSQRCKTNATRQQQGYGKASEISKRDAWMHRHHDVEELINKISLDCN